VETSKDLFKDLEIAEKLFLDGSIKNAQKKVRDVYNKTKKIKKIPNKLRHKLNAAINQSKYFDEISSFATNPKRDELITNVKNLIDKPLSDPRKHARAIHNIQGQWQLLDTSSKSASKSQWLNFNELTNKAWESCKEYFEEMKEIKINNARERHKIIEEINNYVMENQKKWPSSKVLVLYLKKMYEKWQSFAPVLDKDLNNLKTLYFASRKPINDAITKQEKINKENKELLILKVNEINDDDNKICIDKFNELKNQWQKIGNAGRKYDNALWSKFNKSADRFFIEKKQAIAAEIEIVNVCIKDLQEDKKTFKEIEKDLKELQNLKHTKEFKEIQSLIQAKKVEGLKKIKKEKILNYKNIYNVLIDKDLKGSARNFFEEDIDFSYKNKESNLEELINCCVRLEILANLDSLKKHQAKRDSIQLELLQNKFNKNINSLDDIDSVISNFIKNFSANDANNEHKTLWKRMEKCFEELI
tara:strand:+ start:4081 stop:5502 length:1422 start_codon:yes stop_codon:yes gene_type:complete